MRKAAWCAVIVLVLVVLLGVNAYADEGQVTAWKGFWNSVGGFLYNALPWNWGKWMGHSA